MSTRESQRERPDLGPDPVYGLGIGIVGLVVTAVGGALTWHYTFNVGQGIMLLGAAVFLTCGAWTELKRTRAIATLRERLQRGLADDEHDWVTGHSRCTHIERKIEVEISDDGYEAIAELLGGRPSQVGQTLSYQWGKYKVRLGRTDAGGTLVRVRAVHGDRFRLILVSAGSAVFPAYVLWVAVHFVGGSFWAGLALVLAIIGTTLAVRALGVRNIAKQRAQLKAVIEAIADLADEHARPERAHR